MLEPYSGTVDYTRASAYNKQLVEVGRTFQWMTLVLTARSFDQPFLGTSKPGDSVEERGRIFADNVKYSSTLLRRKLIIGAIKGGVQTIKSPRYVRSRGQLQTWFHQFGFAQFRIWRLVQAYTDPGAAGIELVGAVLRQGSFIEKMVDLGWTAGGRFDDPSSHAPLARCIARYHAFFFMMELNPGLFLVPTLVS